MCCSQCSQHPPRGQPAQPRGATAFPPWISSNNQGIENNDDDEEEQEPCHRRTDLIHRAEVAQFPFRVEMARSSFIGAAVLLVTRFLLLLALASAARIAFVSSLRFYLRRRNGPLRRRILSGLGVPAGARQPALVGLFHPYWCELPTYRPLSGPQC